ncbi:hypothetical protein GGI25_004822 [Coemansia spiralis]|uniref:Copper acquisition factor BIM1-like domain-containing protein n=2 Tax=Coemansia TaxID=4863 RepID=A0A9W8FZR8_9FUNG|nr:hypothetical protein EDC05_004801 [Coemansia umbellata]KAJ2620276.1 hypothetical protein GGI26_005165 [Coemansia sp. RSA 1358]KAJ2673228.1 hypothetical protein GGI25_004822 [Coemansia spiralis]
MVKLLAGILFAAVLAQSAFAHMQIISPSPRNGVVADELSQPCGGINTPTKNVTTVSDSETFNFVLRPSHGTGNIVLSYSTVTTVSANSAWQFMSSTDVPVANTYKIPVKFNTYNLTNGESIVVQAIYNGTDDNETEKYYACFDVKLSADASSSSGSATEGESGGEDGLDTSTNSKDHSSSATSLTGSSLCTAKAVFGAAFGLLVAAAAF